MSIVEVAAWLVQDRTSPRKKVYGAAAWVDPATGEAMLFTAHGTQSQLTAATLVVMDEHDPNKKMYGPVSHDPAQVAKRFEGRRDEKRHYGDVLGGPAVVEVDESALADPRNSKAIAKFLRDHIYRVAATGSISDVAHAALYGAVGAAPAATPSVPASRPTLAPSSAVAPIDMPDGSQYFPRMVGGVTDVELLRCARTTLRAHIGLYGSTGTGKSTLPVAAFGADNVIYSKMHGDSKVADLLGKFVPAAPGDQSASGFVFRPGPLYIAMREGKVFVADEINRAPSETVAVLLGATDASRTVVLDDLPGQTLTAADGFMVVATWNEHGVGTAPLDEAILRRLAVKVEVTNDYDAAARRGVGSTLLKVARNLATMRASAIANDELPTWVIPVATLLECQAMADAGLGDEIVVGTLAAACPEEYRTDEVLSAIETVFNVRPAPLSLGSAA